MDNNHIIVINSGSSSIKFSVYELNASLPKLLYGIVENIHDSPVLKLYDENDILVRENHFEKDREYRYFYELLFSAIKTIQFGFQISAVGHRVVHGGNEFHNPVFISSDIMKKLEQLIPFAPLHQPYSLEAIESISKLDPELQQIACFDTAFHNTHPYIADLFGLPRRFFEAGVRRYGFHGLSYEFIMHRLNSINPQKYMARVVIAHLGNGASMCAVKQGKSIDSTMGFTTLDGLVMGTRCGNIDPGVILYLLQSEKMSPDEIQNLLYKESGLLGISGITFNMQELRANKSAHAKEAIDLFVYRIRRELGALTAALGGLDVLVFTGGIGENSWQIREAVCQDSEWLGIEIDTTLNKTNQLIINAPKSYVDIYTIPTDEEWVIANHCYRLIKNKEL
ncbi:acetate/propionate family kinase [Legionella parisiensis]|uniref:Acetate kinase n=1 Tax=Legionella parisiensis TaxID=45071 RepID=A0A1E5JS02_9GAMM|nr:acetate/propionate family kinase [Legionella parisiensis]KTD43198.1 Acetate kinase (Acetokinase) [Legionella parisiensis]OEH46828.1 Acetate kinase [Legionella parisiensis]STX77721.1 Acetate kinase (Acetokinase) [Legionella parisiensis]